MLRPYGLDRCYWQTAPENVPCPSGELKVPLTDDPLMAPVAVPVNVPFDVRSVPVIVNEEPDTVPTPSNVLALFNE